ncbi:MAG: discoidin domain-containing protein [Clostridia bacterium]|nr:discoidin domain-containing protein [Clostridia bacterium]
MNNIGIIIELEKSKAVIVTDSYDFIKIKKKPNMYLGQKVPYQNKDILGLNSRLIKISTLVASTAAVIILLFIFFYLSAPNDIYAYVDVDINPSVELAINNKNIVIETKPMNEDAEKLLSGLDVKKMNITDALDNIVSQSKKYGFIGPAKDNIVLISASLNEKYKKTHDEDENDFNTLLLQFERHLNTPENKTIITKVVKISPESRKNALENNISMGRYLAYAKSMEKGLDYNIDEIKTMNLGDVLREVQIIPLTKIPQNSFSGIQQKNTPAPLPGASPSPNTLPSSNPAHTPQSIVSNATPSPVKPEADIVVSSPTTILEDDSGFQAIPVSTPTPTATPGSEPTSVLEPTPALEPTPIIAPTSTPTVSAPATPNTTKGTKPTPIKVNFAFGMKVTASAYNKDKYPKHVVDGNPDTYWAAPSSSKQWIYVDLEKTRTISSLKIQWSSRNYAKKYAIKRWNGSEWVTAATLAAKPGWNTVCFSKPLSTRWISIVCYEKNDAYFTIYELQALGNVN